MDGWREEGRASEWWFCGSVDETKDPFNLLCHTNISFILWQDTNSNFQCQSHAPTRQDPEERDQISGFSLSRETFPRTTLYRLPSHTNSWANHWERDWETLNQTSPPGAKGWQGLPEACGCIHWYGIIEEKQQRREERSLERWRGLDTGQTSTNIHYNIYMGKLAYGVRKSNYTNW